MISSACVAFSVCSTQATVCSLPWFITDTARSAPAWSTSIIALISCVDCCVRLASVRTSSATTAKPLPCSPARAASMAAFKASRLVWSATPRITSRIPPMLALSWWSLLITSAASWTSLARISIIRLFSSEIWRTFSASASAWRIWLSVSSAFCTTNCEVECISVVAVATWPICDFWSWIECVVCAVTAEVCSDAAASCSARVLIPEISSLRLPIRVLQFLAKRPNSSWAESSRRCVKSPDDATVSNSFTR